jgi:hypothetical protein
MSQRPHDALVKRVFSDRENAAAELRVVLPPEITQALDFGTLRLCPGTYVDEALRDLHSDLLYSVELGGREALIYVLYEHQSQVDPFMPFRMLRYLVRVWDEFRREHPQARQLPAVIPVVLHHGASRWTGPTSIHQLIDLRPELLATVREHVPELRMLLDDLGVQTEEALYRRAMSAYGRLALMALRAAGVGALDPEALPLWIAAFHELVGSPKGVEALEPLLRYLVQVLGDDGRDVIDIVANHADDKVKEAYVTLYDRIHNEGREEGRNEGRKEERRVLVLKLVTLKFGSPSEATTRRIAEAGSDELETWAERILFADRLDDLWG